MNKKGFTLVELMVVLAILGLLAGIGIPSYMNVLERARVGTDIARIAQVQAAMNAFMAESGKFTFAAGGKLLTDEKDDFAAALAGKSIVTGQDITLADFWDDFEEDGDPILPALESEFKDGTWMFDTQGQIYVSDDDDRIPAAR